MLDHALGEARDTWSSENRITKYCNIRFSLNNWIGFTLGITRSAYRIALRDSCKSPRARSSSLFKASTMNASKKRKREGDSEANPSVQPAPSKNVAKPASRPLSSGKGKEKAIELESHTSSVTTTQTSRKRKIKKLAPSRPFPTVPTSVSATGPRSAHKEGKNYICLTRKTPLGMYLRRCKEVILNDGCVDIVSPYPYSFLIDHPKGLKHFIWAQWERLYPI